MAVGDSEIKVLDCKSRKGSRSGLFLILNLEKQAAGIVRQCVYEESPCNAEGEGFFLIFIRQACNLLLLSLIFTLQTGVLTYQIKAHIFRLLDVGPFTFPNDVLIKMLLGPPEPFGTGNERGRTAVLAVPAKALFDANTGRHFIQSEKPLTPLEVVIDESPIRVVKLKGNVLTIQTRCDSLEEINQLIEALYYGLPILINIEYIDPPFVRLVEGKVGKIQFRWELKDWRAEFETTTQEEQEKKFSKSWLRLSILSNPANRRLIAALHYFHTACRLIASGNSPSEFMSEAILNFSKVLEVLFPASGEQKSLDAARSGLKQLGYSDQEIEAKFIPTMSLRNAVDVGHVTLALLTMDEIRTVNAYTEIVERFFRELLQRIIECLEVGSFTITPYTLESGGDTTKAVIRKMKKFIRELH